MRSGRRVVASSALLLFAGSGCSRGHARPSGSEAVASASATIVCPSPPPPLRLDPSLPGLTAGAPSERGLVVQLDAEPPMLLPMLHPDWTSWTILGHLVEESLLRVDPRTGTALPELAEAWEVDDTRTRWKFHLRHGVTWHDGEPFTADDVLFTFERLLDPDVGAPNRALFSGARLTKQGPFEVELTLRAPLASATLDFDRLLILPRHRFPRGDLSRSSDATAPMGTGPMRFVSWSRATEIALARNDHYWGPPSGLRALAFRFVTSRPALLSAVEHGEIDAVLRAPIELAERVEKDAALAKQYEVLRAAGSDYTAWIQNVASPKLKDVRVRRALGLSIDRDALRAEVERCGVAFALGPLSLGHAAFADIDPPRFDPHEAARLLDEAGIVDADGDGKRDQSGTPFTVTLLYPATSRHQERAATVVADELRRLGVKLELEPLEWAQFLRRLETHDFDLAAIEWSIDTEPDLFPLFHSSQVAGSLNYGAYQDRDVDGWLEELRSELPRARRDELLHDVILRLRRDEPYTFLFSPLTIAVIRRGTYGVAPTALGWEPRAWSWASSGQAAAEMGPLPP